MNQETGRQLSIFSTFGQSRHLEKEAVIAAIRAIAPSEATMEDMVGFLQIAHRFDLDPWAKEIFLIKSKGKVSTYIGVDGYSKVINREPQFDGMEFRYDQDDSGKIIAVTCTMYRKDRSRPTVVTEFLDECFIPTSEAWKKAPGRMLRHRAMIQAARYAFGVTGALDYDEAGVGDPTMTTIDVTPRDEEERPTPPKPKRQAPAAPGRPQNVEVELHELDKQPPQERAPAPAAARREEDFGTFLKELSDNLASAKSVEELKTIYNDSNVDEALANAPRALDDAQNAFLAHMRRLEGKDE